MDALPTVTIWLTSSFQGRSATKRERYNLSVQVSEHRTLYMSAEAWAQIIYILNEIYPLRLFADAFPISLLRRLSLNVGNFEFAGFEPLLVSHGELSSICPAEAEIVWYYIWFPSSSLTSRWFTAGVSMSLAPQLELILVLINCALVDWIIAASLVCQVSCHGICLAEARHPIHTTY